MHTNQPKDSTKDGGSNDAIAITYQEALDIANKFRSMFVPGTINYTNATKLIQFVEQNAPAK